MIWKPLARPLTFMSLRWFTPEARSAYDSPEVSHRASRTARIQRNQLKHSRSLKLAGGHCHYRDPRGDAVAGAGKAKLKASASIARNLRQLSLAAFMYQSDTGKTDRLSER